jgi:tetratricopeptide (TPR) repeat protein/transcriptional regulator with XRE-family HTH domain
MNAEDEPKAPKAKGFSRTIASRIRQEREQRAWTQSEVAERIGSTRINISRWENGTTVPSLYYRQKLAELFEKDVQAFSLISEMSEFVSDEVSALLDTSRNTPLWNVPHRRNPFFTGREELLNQLYTVFHSRQASGLILALSGLGGVGKTQIAIEYAHSYRHLYQAILWVNASTRDTLSTDFIMLASLLDLSKQQDQEEVVVQAVKHWLTANTGWLLILDNVDSLKTVLEFLPTYWAGDVLLTTRLQVLGTIAQSFEVEKMSQDEGVTFLLRRTKLLAPSIPLDQVEQESQLDEAAKIVEELGGLPLALDQASAYIEETRCGLSQYLHRYNSHRKELLLRRGSYPINHPEPVATTWQLSFQEIEEKWPASAELLSLCAFLDADSIPEELLINGASKLGPILSKVVGEPLKLDSTLEPLYAYSLIRRSPETHSLTMHRLVQAVLRQDLPLPIQKRWAECVIYALNHVFPEVDITTWTQCQQLLPQVLVCVQLFDEYDLLLPEAGHLFMRAGDYAHNRAMYAQAEVFFQRALTVCERVFSPEHPDTAMGLLRLGELYRVWGRYKVAEPLLLRALAIYQQALPPDHLDIANTLNCLGELYHNLGRYKEAESLFQHALAMSERISGPDHPATVTTLHHLARLYHDQQRYKEAELLYQQVLSAQERLLGPKHFEIAVTLNNLAILYRNQCDYIQAEALLKRALQIEEEVRGPDHPGTAIALHNLAIVYRMQKHYQEAEVLFQRALAIKETSLGLEHLSTVKTVTNLARLYLVQKRYAEARELFKRVLMSELGENHPSRVVILRNLARSYYEEGNYGEAETFYLRALSISENIFPTGYSDMIMVLEALAELYRTLGREEKAIGVEQRAIALKAGLTF